MKKSREVINTWDSKHELWFCAEAFHVLLASWEGRGARTIINILKEDKIYKLCKVGAFVGLARGRIVLKHVVLAGCRSSCWAFMFPWCGMDAGMQIWMALEQAVTLMLIARPDRAAAFLWLLLRGAFQKDSEVLERPCLEMITEEVYTGTVWILVGTWVVVVLLPFWVPVKSGQVTCVCRVSMHGRVKFPCDTLQC